MKATRDFAASLRARGRLTACGLVLALAASVVAFAPASASAQQPNGGPIYMALGDSISFGYSQQRFNENYPTESPSRFENGVANDLAKTLSKSIGKNLSLINLACPGETSNGLIGENELLGGKISTEETAPPAHFQGPGDWHPCAYHNVDGFPLHAGYSTESQLEDALKVLTEENKITKKLNEVKLITLNIGNNDILGLLNQCTFEEPTKVTICFVKKINATIGQVLANISDTLGVLEAHYSGPIVLFGGYDPLSFVDIGFDAVAEGINKQFTESVLPHFPHTTLANPFPVFNPEAEGAAKQEKKAEEKEQKGICKYTEMCNPDVQSGPGLEAGNPLYGKDGDIHPSLKGYKELAKLANEAYEKNPAK